LNTHYLFISANAKSVFSWGHSGRSSGHPAPLHRQATIRMAVCRPQRPEATHLITGPSRSNSTPLESPERRRELSRLFETDPPHKQFGFSSENHISIRSKSLKTCRSISRLPHSRFRAWALPVSAFGGLRGQKNSLLAAASSVSGWSSRDANIDFGSTTRIALYILHS
jgi:hypothetical protein